MNQLPLFDPQFDASDEFALDVERGFNQPEKTIPCKYLYDDVGSALFDAITHLQEYPCTRGEKRLLRDYSEDIFAYLGVRPHVVELGGGSGDKALLLLSSAAQQNLHYHNVDISQSAVALSGSRMSALSNVIFHGHCADFLTGLRAVMRGRRQTTMTMFLGSSIGNFSAPESTVFLAAIRAEMQPGDLLLLGTDLVKPVLRLLSAYDDPRGVTSAFNKNILSRINHEHSANFDLSRFAHEARWNPQEQCIEMHLRSLCDQVVRISRINMLCAFTEGETIRTERSYKYRAERIDTWLTESGWVLLEQWIDAESQFALNLARAI